MDETSATTLSAGGMALQAFIFVVGLSAALVASSYAVKYARSMAAQLGAPAFIVGVVLVAIGTDLPEIANSVSAHLQGEADVNVGDSVGSALTQYTLVLGLFPLIVVSMGIDRRSVAIVSILTAAGLGITTIMVADGFLSRPDGAILVVCWAIFTLIVVRSLPHLFPEDMPETGQRSIRFQLGAVVGTLVVVAFGATFAVRALVRLAEAAGVPQFVIAFFGASFGTSAPEIVVVVTALLAGAPAIALGDALGSSLADATLSIGVGPLAAPGEVTTRLAVAGSLYSLVAILVVGALLAGRRRHDRKSMVVLFGLYGLAYVVVLGAQ